VQPVHVRRTFHRMQSDGTMNLLLLKISGERLGIKNRLHLCGIITYTMSIVNFESNDKYDKSNILLSSHDSYSIILHNLFLFLHVFFPFFSLTENNSIEKSLKHSNSFLKRSIVLIALQLVHKFIT